jgi:hypothetical protein
LQLRSLEELTKRYGKQTVETGKPTQFAVIASAGFFGKSRIQHIGQINLFISWIVEQSHLSDCWRSSSRR